MAGLEKDARAVIGWAIDWGARGRGRRVIDCQWRVAPDEPGGLDVVRPAIEGSAVSALIGGGRPGVNYRIEARARMSDGAIVARAIGVSVGAAV